MKILHATHSATKGGAARASFRLHVALREMDVASAMLVADCGMPEKGVHTVQQSPLFRRAARRTERAFMKMQRTSNTVLHSPALVPGVAYRALMASRPDIIQLHWVGAGFLSIEQIGRLASRRRLVWRMPDMWPFCGSEHVTEIGDRRPQEGYSRFNRSTTHEGLDIDRLVWLRKRRSWRHPIRLIATSRWLADQASTSALMAGWPISIIPNALNLDAFAPVDRSLARRSIGVSPDVLLIAFGADGGPKQLHKGWEILKDSLQILSKSVNRLQLAIFGTSNREEIDGLPFPVHDLGYIRDDRMLAKVYSAADVVVVPSLREAFGQVASEAQACGAPVVAFTQTGIADIIEDGVTGVLVDEMTPAALSAGIRNALSQLSDLTTRNACSCRARRLFSPRRVAAMYLDVYSDLIASELHVASSQGDRPREW